MVITYQKFGTTYGSPVQVALNPGPLGWPETSAKIYLYTLRSIPEERGCRPRRGGSLKLGVNAEFVFATVRELTYRRQAMNQVSFIAPSLALLHNTSSQPRLGPTQTAAGTLNPSVRFHVKME